MSATTSFPNPEPPPLLFSSPPFSPRSPLHHTQTPASPPPLAMEEPEDVDMTTSVVLPAQNHDRNEDAMEDDGAPNAEVEEQRADEERENSERQPNETSDDAMDTTPDVTPAPETVPTDMARHSPERTTSDQAGTEVAVPAPTAPAEDSNGSTQALVEGEASSTIQPESSSPADPSNATIPPPPPPNAESSNNRDDASSVSSEDDDVWRPIHEDTSVPDENELKEIEASREHSALEHEYWEKSTFAPLDDPEHKPGAHGRIIWTIDHFNGTRENPNNDLIMESHLAEIGGYKWKIKLYPNGINNNQQVSVFVSCEDMAQANERRPKPSEDSQPKPEASDPAPKDSSVGKSNEDDSEKQQEWLHTPLPLLDPKRIPKRPSVAAQVSVCIFNPEEPRSNFFQHWSHRFCPGEPDCGLKHYGRTKEEFAIRMRSQQREAILRRDKIALVARIRLVHDETGCLWERTSQENPYDSLKIIGLQGIAASRNVSSGGNLISAISSWMLMMPFRRLLYEVEAPNPFKSIQRPKPMLLALQYILYNLRTRPERVGNGPFNLEPYLTEAFEWYGMDQKIELLDTVETWEILRVKLQEELEDTDFKDYLNHLFGPMRDRSTNQYTYRVPVRGSGTMQKAIDASSNLLDSEATLPEFITLELERYVFDETARGWSKISEKVSLDEHVTIRDQGYTLFGFIVNKEGAQSGYYHSVLRPNGPSGKWYMYTDSCADNHVRCLTRKAAIEAYAGTAPGRPNHEQASVAYLAIYVRDDTATQIFDIANEPEWNVPEWIVEEVKKDRGLSDIRSSSPPPPGTEGDDTVKDESDAKVDEEITEHEFTLFRSSVFSEYQGPGFFDMYDQKWHGAEHALKIVLKSNFSPHDVKEVIKKALNDEVEPWALDIELAQIRVWAIDAAPGTQWKPNLVSAGHKDLSGYESHDDSVPWSMSELLERAPQGNLWLHVLEKHELPPSPPVPPQPQNELQAENKDTETTEPIENGAVVVPEAQVGNEDQPMGGTQDEHQQEEAAASAVPPAFPVFGIDPIAVIMGDDIAMGDFGANISADAVVQRPPSNLPVDSVAAVFGSMPVTTPDTPPPEMYFFLKLFDPETQTLKAYGSHMVSRKARIDHILGKIIRVSKDDKSILFFEERNLIDAVPLRRRRTFADENLSSGSIIIAQRPLSDEAKAAFQSSGKFADPQSYLNALTAARTFPHTAHGTFKLDYFSDEIYEGQLSFHKPHGEGRKIYHNADVYTGTFNLGQRHGHGTMTFSNGDTYTGSWSSNLQSGEGTSVHAETGNRYEGGWKNGKRHGKGVTHWEMAQSEAACCKICWEEEANAAFVECGHVVACLGCAKMVRECPVCRRGVARPVRLWFVA